MTILLHPSFAKSYQKRIKPHLALVRRTAERLALFEQNPRHPVLRDHALIGKKLRLRALSITGDIRIVYQPLGDDRIRLLDIGTHNQVY